MKRSWLLLVLVLSLNCFAGLIIAPAVLEGVAGDLPLDMTLEIYNRGTHDHIIEVRSFDLTQKENGVVQINPERKGSLLPEMILVDVKAGEKATLILPRESILDPLYEAVVLKKAALEVDKEMVSQALVVPIILKSGFEKDDGGLDKVTIERYEDRCILDVTIKNSGKEHFQAELEIKIFDKTRGTFTDLGTSKGIILPDVARTFSFAVLNEQERSLRGQLNLKIGKDSQIYDFSFAGNQKTATIE